MSSLLPDPDAKIYMSLDEIIRLNKGQKNNQLVGRNFRTMKKKNKNSRKGSKEAIALDHSVPLLSSAGGVDIYVTRQSPLLTAENRRRIAQAVSNRVANSGLLQKSKAIIPAEYKLVKTNQGFERVLVPAAEYMLKTPRKKLSQPRKLSRTNDTLNSDFPKKVLPDKPPPLVAAPIFRTPSPPQNRQVEEPEVVIMEPPICKKQFEIIDVESDMAGDFSSIRDLSMPALLSVPQSCGQTLNDRFTILIENFHS